MEPSTHPRTAHHHKLLRTEQHRQQSHVADYSPGLIFHPDPDWYDDLIFNSGARNNSVPLNFVSADPSHRDSSKRKRDSADDDTPGLQSVPGLLPLQPNTPPIPIPIPNYGHTHNTLDVRPGCPACQRTTYPHSYLGSAGVEECKQPY